MSEALQDFLSYSKQTKGFIFDIQSYAIHDGPGVRTLVFLKGCPLKCWWCHNPEGQSSKPQLMYYDTLCIHSYNCVNACPENAITKDSNYKLVINRDKCTGCGLCVNVCPTSALKLVGKWISVKELCNEIEKYNQLYSSFESGVTFTGGEPLYQPEFLLEILAECKRHYIHTAIETSGYASRNVFDSIIPYVDLFLYDLKLFDENESIKYTGASSKIIKENLKYLIEKKRNIILRFPIIPGITDTDENVKGWINFISENNWAGEIDLLPFHDVDEKFYRLGMEYKMTVHKAPTQERLEKLKEEFEKLGLKVKIGG
ncbi:MAG: glycyl-radical enzyme activating protein [Thermoplasmata archaeon]